MIHFFTQRSVQRLIARTLFICAFTLSASMAAQAGYQGPVPAPTDAFGGPGPYQVLTETFPSPGFAGRVITVFYPAGVAGPRPTWWFAHGFAGSNPAYYEELLRHLASHGSVVVFSPYPANLLRVQENYTILFDGFTAAAQRYPDLIDTSRVGFAGHSYGGGAVPALALRALRERGWGSNGLALLLLAPWYSYNVTDADLAAFPPSTQALFQVYEDDTINDHRMAIDLFTHMTLPLANKDYLMVRSDRVGDYNYTADHLVPTGSANPRPDAAFNALDAWGVVRMAQALSASALENNAAGREVALSHGSLLQIQMGTTPEGRPLRAMAETLEPVPLFPSSRYVQPFDSSLNPRRESILPATTVRSHLSSVSARAYVGNETDPLLIETTVAGLRPKSLLVRALGPTLADLSGTPALPDPALRLSRGRELDAEVDDWSQSPSSSSLVAATNEVGALALKDGSKDAALLASYWPGPLVARVQPNDSKPGVALLELFDADQDDSARLTTFAVRGPLGTGNDSLVSGFATAGPGELRVLIRGLNPVVASKLPQESRTPALSLYHGAELIASSAKATRTAEAELARAIIEAGAPPVPVGHTQSCLLITLPEGAYSIHLGSSDGQTGSGKIEAYILPRS